MLPKKWHAHSVAAAMMLIVLSTAFGQTLQEHRDGFETTITRNPIEERNAPEIPPDGNKLVLTHYASPVGELAAYATPVRDDGKKRPALIWIKGGFGGIDPWLYEFADAYNDQSIDIYLGTSRFGDRFVVFCPSMRGENDNPGDYEMFLGEVDDLLAAVRHVAQRPDVDPHRIYVAGHSSGGTLALLLAAATDIPAGIISIGGAPDLEWVMADGGYGMEPFDINNADEIAMRSPMTYARMLRTPVLYIEGAKSSYPPDALRMQEQAHAAGHTMDVSIVDEADHFSILHATHRMLAAHLLDNRPGLPAENAPAAMYREFGKRMAAERQAALKNAGSEEATEAYHRTPLQLTPLAAKTIQEQLDAPPAYDNGVAYFYAFDNGASIDWEVKLLEDAPEGAIVTESHGVRVAVDSATAGLFTDQTLHYDDQQGGFVLD